MSDNRLITPLNKEKAAGLKAGDKVYLSGTIYTARDAAHKKLMGLIEKGEKLPFDLQEQIIYYVGPAPAKPGQVIGSAGPTTSGRMDPYAPALLDRGLMGMIGKGNRSEEVKKSIKRNGAVYFAAIGGAAALIAKSIKKAEVVAYPELGPEAIHRLEVVDFPVIVVNDAHGGDLYQEGIESYQCQ